MEDRVSDGRRDSHHRDLADAFDAERIYMRVVLLDKEHLHERRRIGVHRHRVLCEAGVGHPAVAGIHDGMLHQRHADAADHAANALLRAVLGLTMRPAP